MSQSLDLLRDIPVAPADVDLTAPIVRSLVTLMRLHGKHVSPQFLVGGNMTKVNPAACLRAARRAGVASSIMRRDDLTSFTPMLLPCVLLLRNDNSLVLCGIQEDTATVIMPEYGEDVRHIPLEKLREEYLGYAIFAAPAEADDGRVRDVRLLKAKRWFWDVLLHYWPIYKHVVVASVIVNVIGVAGSLFAMNVYDRVVPNNALPTLWVLTVGISIAYFFDFLLRNLRSYFVDVAGRNADVVLSSTLMDKVLRMRYEARPESTGALVNNLREFDALRDFFSSGTLLTLVDLPFLLLFLIIVGIIGGPLIFAPLLSVPIMVGMGMWVHMRIRRYAETSFKSNMQKNAFLVEAVNGLETIRSSQGENNIQRQWERIVGISALSASQSRRYNTLASTMSSSLTQLVTVGVIVWGVYLIADDGLTMGGLIGCNILIGRAMAPLMQLSTMLGRVQQSRMALRALDLLMETPSEDAQERAQVDFGTLRPAFALDHVSFSYPRAGRKALDDVSLRVNAGERVAVIGRMGSGKSTLGKLVMGLYPPGEGTVSFDDVDIRQIHTADVRGRMGILPQDVVLFYGTVRDNITLSDPTVSDRLVLRAASIAGVTDFVRHISAGFGEQVGERGMNLSGGQRQSVALARTLLHDPDVLILDEPTSNMDIATEDHVKQQLREILPGKTLLLITHRLSLLDLVDRVVVMEGGKILMDGPRDQVLRQLQAQAASAQTTPVQATPVAKAAPHVTNVQVQAGVAHAPSAPPEPPRPSTPATHSTPEVTS